MKSVEIQRYSMIGTPGGYREYEDEGGEWVKAADLEGEYTLVNKEHLDELLAVVKLFIQDGEV